MFSRIGPIPAHQTGHYSCNRAGISRFDQVFPSSHTGSHEHVFHPVSDKIDEIPPRPVRLDDCIDAPALRTDHQLHLVDAERQALEGAGGLLTGRDPVYVYPCSRRVALDHETPVGIGLQDEFFRPAHVQIVVTRDIEHLFLGEMAGQRDHEPVVSMREPGEPGRSVKPCPDPVEEYLGSRRF